MSRTSAAGSLFIGLLSRISLLLLFIALGLMSCGRGAGSPLAPGTPSAELPTPETPAALAQSSWQSGASSLFGLVTGTINPDGTVEVDPPRQAVAVGNIYDLDATQFFTNAPCRDCARLSGFAGVAPQRLGLDFTIRHPFPDTLPRRDLHVFDVRGILILPGTTTLEGLTAPVNTGLTTIETQTLQGAPGLVTNADGYTTHFDYHGDDPRYRPGAPPIPGNLNAFRRFFEDSATPLFQPATPSGWNVLAMGAGPETQRYILDMTRMTQPLSFAFVVDARWGESAIKATRTNPTYYLPAFNRQEAWRVDPAITSNNLQGGDATSSASLELTIYDWQAHAEVASQFPDPAKPGEVPWAGDVGKVEAIVPGLSTLDEATDPVSGGGTPASPYLYRITINNDLQAVAGTYWGVAAVRDQLYLAGLSGPGGIPELPGVNQGLDLKDYTTYVVFQLAVAPPVDDPPVADATATTPTSVLMGEAVLLDGSRSADDGAITKYEWDPGDGSGWQDRGLTPTLSVNYSLPVGVNQQIFTAQLRVTDDAAQSSTASVDITVSRVVDHPPTAVASSSPANPAPGQQVTLIGSASTDDFGIVKYRWNPGDGTGWVDNGATPNRQHTYSPTTTTSYTATLEVTDTSNQTATTTTQITVTVANQGPIASLTGTAPTSGASPLQVTFDGSTSSDDQGIVKFEFDPGDGTGWVDRGLVPTYQHTYTVASSTDFTARLRVTDGPGLTHTAQTTISVSAAAPCSLTGISGVSVLNNGQTITLTAQGSSASYEWTENSPKISLVGPTNQSSVQVAAIAGSASLNDITVTLTGSTPGCTFNKTLTVYTVEMTAPAAARKQYVNFSNGGPSNEGTNVQVTARVVPAKSGVNLAFTFVDPDLPTFSYVSGTSWTSGGEVVQTGDTDTNGNDNLGDNLRPNGSSTGQPYTIGYDNGGGIYKENLTVATDGSGNASAIFRVSRYGGDNYQFVATGDPAGGGVAINATSPTVTVWRKYIVPVYSMKNSSGTDPVFYKPDTTQVNNYFSHAYIEAVNMPNGFGGMTYLSPLNLSVTDQFNYVETTGNYAAPSEKYSQTPHGQFCGGIDRYSSSGTIGLWTGSYNPSKVPPTGVGLNDKPYNTRNYFTVATGRIKDLWSGGTYTELINHVFVHEMGHSLGLPHNSSSTTGNPQLSKHGSNGIGIMAPATGPGVSHLFTLSELQFLRGADTVDSVIYRGPYYE